MPPITRRGLVGASTAGMAGLGLIGSAQAAALPQAEPADLRGTVQGGKVSLPPLDTPADIQAKVPNPDPAPRRLGIAVVGLGRLSLTEILPAFAQAKHVKVTALVSGEPEKARIVAAQYGVPERGLYDYKTYDGIRNNPDIDIVYIVLPNALHAEYTIRAAQAGKHVLCEKPMATSAADAQRMIAACKAANRKLMIAYRCQYAPEFRTLLEMTRKGSLGQIRLITASNGQDDANDGQWRLIRALSGGGSLPDVGLYCLNTARFLTGEEPVEISAQISQPKDDPRFREVEDICAFTLRFPSGTLATCTSGYSYHESRTIRLLGTEAWAAMDPAFGYDNLVLHTGRRNGLSASQDQRRWAPKSQFALEMDAFAQAIRTDRTPFTPGEEGLQDMRLMEIIYQAAAAGHPMSLPGSPGLDVTRGPWIEEKT